MGAARVVSGLQVKHIRYERDARQVERTDEVPISPVEPERSTDMSQDQRPEYS